MDGPRRSSLSHLAILLTSLSLFACNHDDSTKAKLFEEQRAALEKAKAVESIVQKQAQELQQNINKQAGAQAAP